MNNPIQEQIARQERVKRLEESMRLYNEVVGQAILDQGFQVLMKDTVHTILYQVHEVCKNPPEDFTKVKGILLHEISREDPEKDERIFLHEHQLEHLLNELKKAKS